MNKTIEIINTFHKKISGYVAESEDYDPDYYADIGYEKDLETISKAYSKDFDLSRYVKTLAAEIEKLKGVILDQSECIAMNYIEYNAECQAKHHAIIEKIKKERCSCEPDTLHGLGWLCRSCREKI